MDIGLTAGMMARLQNDTRYEGCAMLSALPDAPLVDDRPWFRRWLRRSPLGTLRHDDDSPRGLPPGAA